MSKIKKPKKTEETQKTDSSSVSSQTITGPCKTEEHCECSKYLKVVFALKEVLSTLDMVKQDYYMRMAGLK